MFFGFFPSFFICVVVEKMDSPERASKKAKTVGIGGELKGETEAKWTGDEAVVVVGLHGSPEPLARVSTVPLLLGAGAGGGEQNCLHCGIALDRSLAGTVLSCDMCARLLHVSCTTGTLCHGCQLGLKAAGGRDAFFFSLSLLSSKSL